MVDVFFVGGMVMIGVAGRVPERITRFVAVDGFVPMPGESSKDLTDAGLYEEVIGGPARHDGDGWRVPAWADEELGEACVARVRDHPLRTLTDPVVLEHGPPTASRRRAARAVVWPGKDLTLWAPSISERRAARLGPARDRVGPRRGDQ